MNRREAIAALVSLPQVAKISTVPEASKDVIVVECDVLLTNEMCILIKHRLSEVWPNREIVVLEQGIRIKVAPA